MKSKIIAQIHDSMLGDVHNNEKNAYLDKLMELVTVDLPKAWKWIIVPLKIEIEICQDNWYNKVPYEV
jgi:DNA polymerase I-like protein with 3'-5' exonuclease and polymerase domains